MANEILTQNKVNAAQYVVAPDETAADRCVPVDFQKIFDELHKKFSKLYGGLHIHELPSVINRLYPILFGHLQRDSLSMEEVLDAIARTGAIAQLMKDSDHELVLQSIAINGLYRGIGATMGIGLSSDQNAYAVASDHGRLAARALDKLGKNAFGPQTKLIFRQVVSRLHSQVSMGTLPKNA